MQVRKIVMVILFLKLWSLYSHTLWVEILLQNKLTVWTNKSETEIRADKKKGF